MVLLKTPEPHRFRRDMTYRDLLIKVTEELMHANPGVLDERVVVYLPGGVLATIQDVTYVPGDMDARIPDRLEIYPWFPDVDDPTASQLP